MTEMNETTHPSPWPLMYRIFDAMESLPTKPTSTHVLIRVQHDLHIVPRGSVSSRQPVLFTWTPTILAHGYSSFDTRALERSISSILELGVPELCAIHVDQADRTMRPQREEIEP